MPGRARPIGPLRPHPIADVSRHVRMRPASAGGGASNSGQRTKRLGMFAAAWALGVLVAGARAAETGAPFTFGGSLRLFAASAAYPDLPEFLPDDSLFGRSLLRLTAAGRPQPWLRFDVHLVNHLDYFEADERFSVLPRLGGRQYQLLESPETWLDGERLAAGTWFDRLNLKIALPGADLTVGRQALSFGKGWFWSPMDVFLPFAPWDVDRDYKRGVDALRLDVPLGRFSGATVVAAAGREIVLAADGAGARSAGAVSWTGSALLGRLQANLRGWDAAVQGGKIYGGGQLACGAAGEIGGLDIRLEAAWFKADRGPSLPAPLADPLVDSHLSVVAGLGHVFRSGLVLGLEYFHNGAARAAFREGAFLRTVHGTNLHLSTDLLGVMAADSVSPRLRWTAAWILSLDDLSFLVQPAIAFSIGDETELQAGATLDLGDGPALSSTGLPRLRSEFGTYPDALYLLVKHYF